MGRGEGRGEDDGEEDTWWGDTGPERPCPKVTRVVNVTVQTLRLCVQGRRPRPLLYGTSSTNVPSGTGTLGGGSSDTHERLPTNDREGRGEGKSHGPTDRRRDDTRGPTE